MGRKRLAQPCLEFRTVGIGHKVVVDELQMISEGIQQLGSRRVLKLGAEREIVADTVPADSHQGPLVADHDDALVRGEHVVNRITELMQRGGVIVKAVIPERIRIRKDKLGTALQGEFLLALSQQEALLRPGRSFVDPLGADRNLPDLIVGFGESIRGVQVALLRKIQRGVAAFAFRLDAYEGTPGCITKVGMI